MSDPYNYGEAMIVSDPYKRRQRVSDPYLERRLRVSDYGEAAES